MVQTTPELVWSELWESSPCQTSPLSSWWAEEGQKKSLTNLNTSAGETEGVSPALHPIWSPALLLTPDALGHL